MIRQVGSSACLLLVTGLLAIGCGDDDGDMTSPTTGPGVTARCEGIGPDSGTWRRGAEAVGAFGLLARDLSNARRLRNGTFGVKMGAVVEGHTPVTLRVPDEARGRVGLIYGDATRGRMQLSDAPVEVTFEPCPNRARSGYVGGLLIDTVREPVTLEVQLTDSRTESLTIQARVPTPLSREAVEQELRARVLAGAERDFTGTTPPPGFKECFLDSFGPVLTGATLDDLVQIREERGQPAAARALNGLAVAVGDGCGGREHVPQLISASEQLPSGG
jgi:hypothetical protein